MKRISLFVSVALMMALTASNMFAWGSATHSYFAKELGARHGFINLNEMYGAVLPDMFNTMFDASGDYLYGQTHNNFALFLNGASQCNLRAVAYGFVGHNDVWGEDFIAHHKDYIGTGLGYIVAVGNIVGESLTPDLIAILESAGLDEGTAMSIASSLAPGLGEDLVETAIDVLVKRNEERAIGTRMLLAASLRPPGTSSLMATAYAPGLAAFKGISLRDAAALIIKTEKEYQKQMMIYGGIFCLDEQRAIGVLAQQSATLAAALLNARLGLTVDIPPALVQKYIVQSIEIAQGSYHRELELTLRFVDRQLQTNGIETCSSWFAKGEVDDPRGADALQPVGFSLGDNFPNPFNPSTTIRYSIPDDARVSLKIYNSLGQEVASLVDNEMPAGRHEVIWDADGGAGGVYFYRLTAGNNSIVKRMILLK